MAANYKNEIDIALLCSKINLTEQDTDKLDSLLENNINWSWFNKFIIAHRIYALVYKNLKVYKDLVPETIFSALKESSFFTGKQNFFYSVFLQKTMTLFSEEQIPVLPFKGPVLSQQLYGDIILRPFADLDILVGPKDAPKAHSLLIKNGLTPQIKLNNSQFKQYIADEDHFTFFDNKNKIIIELHWDLAGLYLTRKLKLSEIKKHLTTNHLNNNTVPVIQPEALLVYLCIHGCKDGWGNLEQVCLVRELILSNQNLDWNKVQLLSIEWKCQRIVQTGLHLVKSIMDITVPDIFSIRKHRLLNSANNVIENYTNDPGNSCIDRFSFFHLIVRDTTFEKLQYAFRLIFRPTDKEWQYFRVPAWFSFIHYFLRPFRLLYFKIRGLNA